MALEIPAAADRGKFLDWACAGARLSAAGWCLLDRHERAIRFLTRPVAEAEEGRDAQRESGH